MNVREAVKLAVHLLATVAIAPALFSFHVRARVIGPDRALQGSTQAFALLPGLWGQYLRRAFLCRVLAACDRTATIEFGTIFSRAGARIGPLAYVGPRCHIGLADIGRGVLIAAGTHIPSGARTHGSAEVDRWMRDQPGDLSMIRIGEGVWIGSAAVVMADVGRHTIVGAGAVVTRPLPDRVVAAGVPARVVRSREARAS